jgi:hypothetical protein
MHLKSFLNRLPFSFLTQHRGWHMMEQLTNFYSKAVLAPKTPLNQQLQLYLLLTFQCFKELSE